MSELKVYTQDEILDSSIGDDVYLQPDVDKILAEKDKKIAELKDKALQYKVLDKEHCRDLNTQERFFAKQIAHNKYKRCLVIAKWCLTEKVYFHYRYDDWGDKGYDRSYKWKKVVFWSKWARRWLELAEKFNEAK
jgi:hypothetical protein